MGVSKHTGGMQSYGGIQTYGVPKHMGAYRHPFSLTKHAVFVLCMYRGHPNIWGHTNIWVVSKPMGACKHTGGVQMYGTYRHPLGLTKHVSFVLCVALVPVTGFHGCQRACV